MDTNAIIVAAIVVVGILVVGRFFAGGRRPPQQSFRCGRCSTSTMHTARTIEAWRRGKTKFFMKRTPKYTDERLGRLEVVEDFLPPPDQLVLKEDGVKVTISLSKRSVEFFKAQAARSRVPYQKMIRSLLDGYASRYQERPLTSRSSGRRSA